MRTLKNILAVLIFLPTLLIGQDYSYTINYSQNNCLIIGPDNYLQVEGFNRNDSLNLEVPSEVRCRRASRYGFHLTVTKPMKNIPIILKNRDEVIDTIVVFSERIKLKSFFKTSNANLIISGEYPLKMVQSIVSIELSCNFRSRKELVISNFLIEIYSEDELILSKIMKGNSLNHPKIVEALKKLNRNGMVEIRKIRANTPGDDGPRIKRLYLKVK